MTMMIWVDSWQMQCCGEPFRLGSQVAWTLRAADPHWLAELLGSDAQPGVDAAEDHHGGVPEDIVPTRGTVRHIAAVHCRFAPRPGSGSATVYPVLGTGLLTKVGTADGWIKDHGEEHFIGYLVRLEV